MNSELYKELIKVTDEEQQILSGKSTIDRTLYMGDATNTIDAAKLLEEGKLIQVRPHTRFVHFPCHTHNYVEVVYMCSGSTHQVIDGRDIILKPGELLFLSKHATQEIFPAGESDLAINFIILPEFFSLTLQMLGKDDNILRTFLVESLISDGKGPSYLHFKVADVLPIQNLVENLIWSIHNRQANIKNINQITMGLIFLQLLNHTDKMESNGLESSHGLIFKVLEYIEENYRDGELKILADELHYNLFWMSKEIKKVSGCTFSELLQKKRLSQAAYLLKNSDMKVIDISLSVGYENVSYFHRIFTKHYGMSPRSYRIYQKYD